MEFSPGERDPSRSIRITGRMTTVAEPARAGAGFWCGPRRASANTTTVPIASPGRQRIEGPSTFQWPKRFGPFMVNGALKAGRPKASEQVTIRGACRRMRHAANARQGMASQAMAEGDESAMNSIIHRPAAKAQVRKIDAGIGVRTSRSGRAMKASVNSRRLSRTYITGPENHYLSFT